tara:strand:- start:686 stop:937 length:252 start_codon:yes stop_codon:yes gene_type:complete
MKTIVLNSVSGRINPDGTLNISSVKKSPVRTINMQLRMNKLVQRLRDNFKREYFSDHSLQSVMSCKEYITARVNKHLSNLKSA